MARETYFGKAIKRVEDPRFLTGTGQFTDDIRLHGMLQRHLTVGHQLSIRRICLEQGGRDQPGPRHDDRRDRPALRARREPLRELRGNGRDARHDQAAP